VFLVTIEPPFAVLWNRFLIKHRFEKIGKDSLLLLFGPYRAVRNTLESAGLRKSWSRRI
jgi:hypothetical protein